MKIMHYSRNYLRGTRLSTFLRFTVVALASLLYACGSEETGSSIILDEPTTDNLIPNNLNILAVGHPGIDNVFQPGAGYDGTRFLIVFYGQDSAGIQIFGTFISEDGTQSDIFTIVDSSVYLSGSNGPVLSFDGTNYLMVYDRTNRIYGVRITPDGTVLDPDGGFQISNIVVDQADHAPVLAFDGTNYLVVWHKGRNISGQRILGALVSPSGVPSAEFFIESDSSSESDSPAISYDGTNYLVAWADDRNAGVNDTHVYVARVTRDGVVLDPEGFPIVETNSGKFSVRSTFDGTNHHVSWWDHEIQSPNLYFSKRVAIDGSLVDKPTTSDGNTVETLAVNGVVIGSDTNTISGDANIVLWTQVSNVGVNGVASSGVTTLVVWDDDAKGLQGILIQ